MAQCFGSALFIWRFTVLPVKHVRLTRGMLAGGDSRSRIQPLALVGRRTSKRIIDVEERSSTYSSVPLG